jgi:hypothetical protein
VLSPVELEMWKCISPTHACSAEDPCYIDIPVSSEVATRGDGKLHFCPPCADDRGELVLFEFIGRCKAMDFRKMIAVLFSENKSVLEHSPREVP